MSAPLANDQFIRLNVERLSEDSLTFNQRELALISEEVLRGDEAQAVGAVQDQSKASDILTSAECRQRRGCGCFCHIFIAADSLQTSRLQESLKISFKLKAPLSSKGSTENTRTPLI